MFAYFLKRKQANNVLNHHKSNVHCIIANKHTYNLSIMLTNKLDFFRTTPRRKTRLLVFKKIDVDDCKQAYIQSCHRAYNQAWFLSDNSFLGEIRQHFDAREDRARRWKFRRMPKNHPEVWLISGAGRGAGGPRRRRSPPVALGSWAYQHAWSLCVHPAGDRGPGRTAASSQSDSPDGRRCVKQNVKPTFCSSATQTPALPGVVAARDSRRMAPKMNKHFK